METQAIDDLIKHWLSIHIDNTVRIEGPKNKAPLYEDPIVAKNNIDCNGYFTKIEYVSTEFGCPCCSSRQDTYYTFDEIDFSGCVLSFECPDGSEVKKYYVDEGRTKHKLEKELSEQEVEEFFDKYWETLCQWSEGQGRAQTHYEVMKSYQGMIRPTIISIQDYGFDDFHQPKYFSIGEY